MYMPEHTTAEPSCRLEVCHNLAGHDYEVGG